MHAVSIILGKILITFLSLFKRGGSLPGQLVLKIDKNIFSYFKLPEIKIVVTGSSGKTSTSYLIAEALTKNGYNVVHNRSGNNLTFGLATLLIKKTKLNGLIKADAIVFETDERYTTQITKYLNPNYMVVTNITRDQPPRHGHYEIVYNCIKNSIPHNCQLIINGDDPLTTKLALEYNGPKTYFGISKHKESFNYPITNALDFIYCPKCHTKLKYNYVSFSNVGSYYCPNCRFKRPNIDYEITNVNTNLTINKKYKVKGNTDLVYTYYNIVAAFAVLATLKIPKTHISAALSDIKLSEKRYDYLKYKKRDCYILSGKNENAPSYNQSINYVSKIQEQKTLVFGFEYISLRYPYKDISWLYDIDFELLKDEHIDQFICVGPFAFDIAVRIKLSGINPKKIKICLNLADVITYLDKSHEPIYAILNLGTDKKFRKIVGEK